MVKLTVLYKKPENIQEFDRHYKEVHIPLAEKMPGLKKFELNHVVGSPSGDSEYHLVANLYYDDIDSLNSSMSSPEGKAAAKDVGNFARGLVQMLICEVKNS